jgi:hypothetical protein
MLFKIGQISSSDPQQVADAVGQAAQTYSQFGMSQARMFAEISAITPMLGGKPEMAATGLRSLYPESGAAAGKLAAAAYEQAFAKGQVSDERGISSRNWGSLERLKDAAAEKNKDAIEDLAEMKRNSERFGSKTSMEIEKLLKGGDVDGLWKRMGELVKQNENNPERAKVLKDAFGLERMNIALGLIGMYQRGEIQKLQKEYEKATGQEAKDARTKADEGSLPHKMELLSQKAEDLSNSIRGIFYEPMKALLEEWKGVFEKLEKDFTGTSGMKRIQSFGGELVTGFREGRAQGSPIPEDNRSVGQMFQDYVATLSPDDFRQAGKMIGKAATDFVTIASQLKDIVGAAHSAMSWLGLLKPAAIASITPGPLPVKAAVGAGVMGYDALTKMGMPEGGPLDERGLFYPTPMEKPGINAVQPRVHAGENYLRPGLQAPQGGWGLPSVNITSQPQVIVNVDDRAIKDAVKVEVKDEIKEELMKDADRNRGNANDKPLMGSN